MISALTDSSVLFVLLAAFAIGARHACDPDHLVALTALTTDHPDGRYAARKLAVAWGTGHGLMMLAVGVPLITLGQALPEQVARFAGVAVGALIVLLGLRLLVRWRRGPVHAHIHSHIVEDGRAALHLHVHAHSIQHGSSRRESRHAPSAANAPQHAHAGQAQAPLRTARSSFGIGLLHGLAGTGGVVIVSLIALGDPQVALVGLVALVVGVLTAMVSISALVGALIARGYHRRTLRSRRHIPAFVGTGSLVFGVWYALSALTIGAG